MTYHNLPKFLSRMENILERSSRKAEINLTALDPLISNIFRFLSLRYFKISKYINILIYI